MTTHLGGFLEEHKAAVSRISKPVQLDDVGALTGQSSKTILFENLNGYPGWRLVDLLFHNRAAQARVLGCEPDRVVQTLATVLERGPRKFRVVEDGPVKEIKLKGDEIDLAKLPVVRHTERDPGPYITSFNVVRDPETGVCNSNNARALVLGLNRTLVSFVTRHVQSIFAKYKAAKEKMPYAICIGAHPSFELAAAYSGLHDGFWDLEYAGTIMDRTLDLV